MVAHSTTKNLKDLEIEHLFLIISHNNQNIIQLLYFLWTDIVPYPPINSLEICQIIPYLNVPYSYHSHNKYYLLIADICTDYVHRLANISILSSRMQRPTICQR